MTAKKRRSGGIGKVFQGVTDSRRYLGSPAVDPVQKGSKKRFSNELVSQACVNERLQSASQLPGIVLRPTRPNNAPLAEDGGTSNDIVDLNLMNKAHSEALREHSSYIIQGRRRHRPSSSHSVSLVLRKTGQVGFGTSVNFRCKGCRFVSKSYKLYESTAAGGCMTNVAAGVALSKVAIKPSDASFLISSLNVNGPSRQTLQKYFSQSCTVAEDVLEEAVTANRGTVHDYLRVVGRADDAACPSASVSLDGQFNRPVYHGYDGKSTTVSEPVLENETGLNLLVAHAVKSKLDGTYEEHKVVTCLDRDFI